MGEGPTKVTLRLPLPCLSQARVADMGPLNAALKNAHDNVKRSVGEIQKTLSDIGMKGMAAGMAAVAGDLPLWGSLPFRSREPHCFIAQACSTDRRRPVILWCQRRWVANRTSPPTSATATNSNDAAARWSSRKRAAPATSALAITVAIELNRNSRR